MKQILILLAFLYFAGCSTSQPPVMTSTPQILFQEPLPEIPSTLNRLPTKLDIDILVDEDGSVSKVRLPNSSGNTAWDTSAIASIQQWKFSPARINEKPIKLWTRLRASIQYVNPLYMSLAKISFPSSQEADSVYHALQSGSDLRTISPQYNIDTINQDHGTYGEVNIYCFPKKIRESIEDLNTNEFTAPMHYGNQYVIFKRLK
jgi:TonB family protein